MCNGKCVCGHGEKISQDNDTVTELPKRNISEDAAASYNNSPTPDTDINGVVVD